MCVQDYVVSCSSQTVQFHLDGKTVTSATPAFSFMVPVTFLHTLFTIVIMKY